MEDLEDPIVMYLVVRENLNMSIGKTAAQVGHAAQMLTMKYFELKTLSTRVQKELMKAQMEPSARSEGTDIYAKMAPKISIFGEWLKVGIRKVVLKASEREWEKLKSEMDDMSVIITDAGHTELEPGTDTVIGLFPIRKSQRSKLVQRLQALK